MAAVAVAYKDFADAFLSYCKPKVVTCPESLTIIFDLYKYLNDAIISDQKRSARPYSLYYKYDAKNANMR